MTFGFDLTEASYSISNQMLSFQMWIMERVSIVTSKTNFKTSSLEELGCKYSVLLRSSGLWRWCVVFIINQCRLRRWLSSESCLSCFGRIFSFLSGSCIPNYLPQCISIPLAYSRHILQPPLRCIKHFPSHALPKGIHYLSKTRHIPGRLLADRKSGSFYVQRPLSGEVKSSFSGQVGPPKVSHLETQPEAYAKCWQTGWLTLNISWLPAN